MRREVLHSKGEGLVSILSTCRLEVQVYSHNYSSTPYSFDGIRHRLQNVCPLLLPLFYYSLLTPFNPVSLGFAPSKRTYEPSGVSTLYLLKSVEQLLWSGGKSATSRGKYRSRLAITASLQTRSDLVINPSESLGQSL